MGIYTRKTDGNFVFTPGEAKLRRLLREAIEQANRIDGVWANDRLRIPDGEESPSRFVYDVGRGWRMRLGTWGACAEALLASGLETPESMECFYSTNEWSHPRCAPLLNE